MEPITVGYKVLDPRAPLMQPPALLLPTCVPCWTSP